MHHEHVMVYGTLGPACSDPKILEQMFREGLDGMRLNLSHTTLEEAADLIEAYHAAAQARGRSPVLIIDLMGPELRIGILDTPLPLSSGDVIGPDALPFPEAVRDALKAAQCGQEVLLDDGKILLTLDTPDRLRVLRGGILKSRKSIALPGIEIRTPALTEADRNHIRNAKAYGVTGVMQPFVRGREDLIAVRDALLNAGGDLRLFAKIENAEGLNKLNEIIPCCDEIVIARGDLGNAMALWELPAAQKRIAEACRSAGRDFTVVTQMLDSMMHREVPTRAEVSDVFNAVLDGAASVMVTGETATGEYPVPVIRYLSQTVREAQKYLRKLSTDG